MQRPIDIARTKKQLDSMRPGMVNCQAHLWSGLIITCGLLCQPWLDLALAKPSVPSLKHVCADAC